MADLSIKRGDTFDEVIILPDSIADGEFVGWTASSQLRTVDGSLIATFTTTWEDDAVRRTVRLFALDTSTWPVTDAHNPHRLDVQFTRTSDNYVRSTDTLTVEMLPDVTQP